MLFAECFMQVSSSNITPRGLSQTVSLKVRSGPHALTELGPDLRALLAPLEASPKPQCCLQRRLCPQPALVRTGARTGAGGGPQDAHVRLTQMHGRCSLLGLGRVPIHSALLGCRTAGYSGAGVRAPRDGGGPLAKLCSHRNVLAIRSLC